MVATALTACGIETLAQIKAFMAECVATALTACGIETPVDIIVCVYDCGLQQRLPLAVLKLKGYRYSHSISIRLQQRLPLAVLKQA